MRLRPRPLAVIAAGAVLCTLISCSALPADDPPTAIVIGVGTGGADVNFDPFNGTNVIGLANQPFYESLVYWNEVTNEFDPVLVESYEMSDDRHTLTMNVRDGITFTDGTALNAEAIATFFDTALEVETFNYYQQFNEKYGARFDAASEAELVITTDAAMGSDFFVLLSFTAIVSPTALVETPETFETESVGTGPYVVDKSTPGVSTHYVRNPDYWNPDAYPYDTIELVAFDDSVAALNALKSGQIDVTQLTIPLALEAEAAGLTMHQGSGYQGVLLINDRDGELVSALGDVRVRQALNYAFDQEAILEAVFQGLGRVSSQPYGPTSEFFVEGGDDRYAYDPERARELLAEAGYADGLTLPIVSEPSVAELEPLILQYLADVGVTAEFDRVADLGTAFERAFSGATPISLMSRAYLDAGLFILQGQYGGYHRDPHLDALLDVILNGTADEAAQASREVGEFVLDEAWYVPIAHPATMWGSDTDVDMIVGDQVGLPRIKDFAPTP